MKSNNLHTDQLSYKMTEGYIYCLSNEAMPGLVKVGGTWSPERTPDIRAKELYTTGVPLPFKIEFAKLVSEPKKKETSLHLLLEQYTTRMPGREFFRTSPEEVMKFFDLMEGTMWEDKKKIEDEDRDEDGDEDEDEDEDEDGDGEKCVRIAGCRDIKKCFTNGQRIRHTIGINKTWIGTYDSSRNGILHNEIFYKSLSGFANAHHRENGSYTHNGVSGWRCTDYDVDGKWMSTSNIKK